MALVLGASPTPNGPAVLQIACPDDAHFAVDGVDCTRQSEIRPSADLAGDRTVTIEAIFRDGADYTKSDLASRLGRPPGRSLEGQTAPECMPQVCIVGDIDSAAFSPDGTKLLTCGLENVANLWDTRTGELVRTFARHRAGVASVAFSPDGSKVLTASHDKTAILWDAASGDQIRAFLGHGDWVNSAVFSPDGSQVLTGSNDATAILWSVSTGEKIRTFSPHPRGISSVAFSPDGLQVLTGSQDGTAILWDARSGGAVRSFAGHEFEMNFVAFGRGGRTVFTGAEGHRESSGTREPVSNSTRSMVTNRVL